MEGSADSDQSPAAAVPGVVRRLVVPEAAELAGLAAVLDDLQHALRCCERLVVALSPPRMGPPGEHGDAALVEALWTSALLAYARCFSPVVGVLSRGDLAGLDLPGDVGGFHDLLLRLRDQYASPDANPREASSVGVAEGEDGAPAGVAVVATPQPTVDDPAVRQLGRLAYTLSTLVDERMNETQARVLQRARELSAEEFAALAVVRLGTPD